LDDFGSGHSSFAYLKDLPVDFLKIDGLFVKGINTEPIDYAMVKAIHDVGKAMGMETIAEYVENEEILIKLKEIGVDYGQGYYFGKSEKLDSVIVTGHAIAEFT
jgi:Amt family ammonium transporter